MKSLEDVYSGCKDKNHLFVKWNRRFWKVHQRSRFGFILEDTAGLKAYVTHLSKQKFFEQATSDDFENQKEKERQ